MPPDAAFFELREPALDERLRLGVAVAAAAVADPEPGEHLAELARREGRAVVGAERQRPGWDRLLGHCSFDHGDRLDGPAADLEAPADDLACAAIDDRVQVAPAVLCDPDRGHVPVPQLGRPLDPEEAGPAAPGLAPAALEQPVLAHHAQHPLAVDRDAELAAGERPDHPVTGGTALLCHSISFGRAADARAPAGRARSPGGATSPSGEPKPLRCQRATRVRATHLPYAHVFAGRHRVSDAPPTRAEGIPSEPSRTEPWAGSRRASVV